MKVRVFQSVFTDQLQAYDIVRFLPPHIITFVKYETKQTVIGSYTHPGPFKK
jgi:hypothetical protein